MEIQGKVIQVLPKQSGESIRGNAWQSQSFIIETQEQYPRKVCIEIFGEDKIKNNPISLYDDVKVSFDLESREFNSRWYTSVRAWKIEHLAQQQAAEQVPSSMSDTLPVDDTLDF
jgi:hypothetical protein